MKTDKFGNKLKVSDCVLVDDDDEIIGPFVIRHLGGSAVDVFKHESSTFINTHNYNKVISVEAYKQSNPEYFI